MIRKLFATAPLMQAAAFVWQEHTREIIIALLLSMVPAYEGRYTIPVALGMGMPALPAYFLVLLASTLPMPFILLLLRPVLDWFYTLPIKPVRKFAAWLERHAEKKRAAMRDRNQKGLSHKLSPEFKELLALYLFVAIPLPGTGVWTGSAIATLFEMPRGKAALAIFLGNVTACLIMLLGSTGAVALFKFAVSR